MLKIWWILIFMSFPTFARSLEISVQPIGVGKEEQAKLKEAILQYSNVEKLLRNKLFRVLSLQIEDFKSDPFQYVLHIYNYTDNRMFEVTGPLNMSISPQIREIGEDIPPTPEEFEAAVQVLSENSKWVLELRKKILTPYEPMPAVTRMRLDENSKKASRLINVGLTSAKNSDFHEIVGVDLSSKRVIRFPNGAPEGSLALRQVCGLPSAGQATTARGTTGSAEIEVRQGDELLWKFTVVRPSASSGRLGSGLEIRNLFYKGQKVLSRAHTPILNVQYVGNRCGPFRDWTYSENPFHAVGNDRAPGIRIASERPQTIVDTQQDRGNFRGVAIYPTEDKVILVTELSASWYRYVSQFELSNDGVIKPSFDFSSVQNSCVCYSHNHHVYWRFDFDIAGTANSVQVSNGTSFRPITVETAQIKSVNNQSWRIQNSQVGSGYDLTPGPDDGIAGSYGVADIWLLRYVSTQIDDSRVRTSTRAALNAFLTGGNLVNQDLVVWYAGHFFHSGGEAELSPSTVGPTLSPVNWQP